MTTRPALRISKYSNLVSVGVRKMERPATRVLVREVHRQMVIDDGCDTERVTEITDSPQHTLDARHQFARTERLGDIVLRIVADALDDRVFLVLRAEHDDGQVAELLHRLAEVEAVHQRHVDVDDGQVRHAAAADHRQCVHARVRRQHVIACALQFGLHQTEDGRIVVHDEYALERSAGLPGSGCFGCRHVTSRERGEYRYSPRPIGIEPAS